MATFAGNPPATPLTGAEIVPITQGGVDKRTTIGEIVDDMAITLDPALIPFTNSGFSADNVEDAIIEAAGGGGGGGGGTAPVVTETTTNLDADGGNSGNYTRFTNASAKTYTFDDAETFASGDEYHGRNVGAGDLTITEAGTMTINAPAGGTLVIPQGGTFTVKIVASDEADLIGVTVAL